LVHLDAKHGDVTTASLAVTRTVAAAKGSARERRLLPALTVVLVALLAAGVTTLELGIPDYGPVALLHMFEHREGRPWLLVGELRLPRLIAASLIGVMLAAAGTILQDTLRNPLGGPELLGVSTGGSAAVAAITVFGLAVPIPVIPFVVLGVGFAIGLSVLLLAQLFSNPGHVALVGAAATAFSGALVLGIISLTPSGSGIAVQDIYRFMAGDLGAADWQSVRILLPWAALLIPLFVFGGRALNLLQLGDDVAAALGMRVRRARLVLFGTAVALTAPVVAVAGPIAFVALFAPHVAREVLRTTDSGKVLLLGGAIGALMTVLADLAARLVISPAELPVGLWTALIGGPALLLLLQRRPWIG
jgi:iron complex transport system permease protein